MGDRYGKGSGGHALIHIETHTLAQLVPTEPVQIQHYAEIINAEKDYSTRIFTINVWICIWSKIMSACGNKGLIHKFLLSLCVCVCVCVCVCPACRCSGITWMSSCVQAPPIAWYFYFSLCRKKTREELHMRTNRHTYGLTLVHVAAVILSKTRIRFDQIWHSDHLYQKNVKGLILKQRCLACVNS